MRGNWRWLAVVAAVVVVSALAAWAQSPAPPAQACQSPRLEPPRLPPVALDPGHGGIDPGAQGGGVLEKNLTLPITLKLAGLLRQAGCPVVLTRETDIALDPASYAGDLRRRREIARESGATALLAVHVDSIAVPSVKGTLVLYPLGEGPGRERSKALAQAIDAALKESFPHGRHSLRESDIPYLAESQVPAVLVEVGFISNAEERRLLTDPDYQRRIAKALAAAVLAFQRAEAAGN
ncbi:MAG: N-acetylmuramoyl-L-alanine amidase family protein [Symbiobacteriia bacterium]